jgi:SP family arabinose:H+ symporter-like MFS transporter
MTMGVNNWRYMFISGGIPAVVFFVLLFFIPESPRWLLQKGHERVVRFLIRKLNPGVNRDKMVEEIKESINIEIMAVHTYLFRKPYLKLVITGIILCIFAQLSGITAIMQLAPALLGSAGISSVSINFPILIIGIISIISAVAAFFLIDSTGRRKLLLIGSAGMSVCLLFFSFLNFTGLQPGFIMAALVIVFTGLFTISLGVVLPVFLSELFPYNIRARGVSLGMFFYWLCTLLVWQYIPKMETETGSGLVFLVFALMTFASFFIYWKFFPEMKGKSLEELERELMNDRT